MDDKYIQELKQYIVDCQMVSYISLCDYMSQLYNFAFAKTRTEAAEKRPSQPLKIFEKYFDLVVNHKHEENHFGLKELHKDEQD